MTENTMHNPETADSTFDIRVLYDRFASSPAEADKTLFADSFRYEPAESHPLTAGPIEGVDDFLSQAFWASDDCDQVQFRIHDIDAGDKISLRGYCSGIYKPTGKVFNTQILHIWTVEDGKLTRLQELLDTQDLFEATARARLA